MALEVPSARPVYSSMKNMEKKTSVLTETFFFFLDSPPESKRQKSEEREIKQVGRDFLFIKNAP